MSLNISHAESAYSSGSTRFEQWLAKSEEQWYRPVIATQLAVFLESIPAEERANFAPQIEMIEKRLGIGGQDAAISEIPRFGQPQTAAPESLPGTRPAYSPTTPV